MRESGSSTRIAMGRFFSDRHMQRRTGIGVGFNEANKQSVQAGLGLGLLSCATIEQELALQLLVVLDIEDFPIMRHWYVVHRKGKRLSAPAQAFRSFVLEEASELLSDPSTSVLRDTTTHSKRRPR